MGDTILYTGNVADSDDTTISMTNEDTTPPLKKENMVYHNQSVVSKSTGLTTVITFDLGSALTIAGVAWFNTNMDNATTFDWKSGAASPPVTNTTALDKVVNGYKEISSTLRYVGFDIVMASGVAQIGEVYIFTNIGTFTGSLKNGLITQVPTLEETNTKNANANINREIYSQYQVFSFDLLNLIFTDLAILLDMQLNEYSCFLPHGADSDIYYGAFYLNQINMLVQNSPFSGSDFTSSARFEESPVSLEEE